MRRPYPPLTMGMPVACDALPTEPASTTLVNPAEPMIDAACAERLPERQYRM